MSCRLIKNIKHLCEYNPGGIKEIILVDIDDFDGYEFAEDKLFDECMVSKVEKKMESYIKIDVTNESTFVENNDGAIYNQTVNTFIRSLSASNTSNLLQAANRKYVIFFSTNDDKQFTFGSDGGASLSFTQLSGQIGEASGYEITIAKKSIYPTFQADVKALYERLLASEARELVITEDEKLIEIE